MAETGRRNDEGKVAGYRLSVHSAHMQVSASMMQGSHGHGKSWKKLLSWKVMEKSWNMKISQKVMEKSWNCLFSCHGSFLVCDCRACCETQL